MFWEDRKKIFDLVWRSERTLPQKKPFARKDCWTATAREGPAAEGSGETLRLVAASKDPIEEVTTSDDRLRDREALETTASVAGMGLSTRSDTRELEPSR